MQRYFALCVIFCRITFGLCGVGGSSIQQDKSAGHAETLKASMSTASNSLLLCAKPRLTSPCISMLWDDLQCMELPLEWDNIVASVATKESGQHCILYRDYGCNGRTFEVKGYAPELENFSNEVSSFRCLATLSRC